MKKFFTLCVAIATMLSAEAAPQFVKKANTSEVKPLMGRQLTDHAVKKSAKVAAQSAIMKQHAMEVSLNKPKRAKAEAYECTYDEIVIDSYETDTWIDITTSNSDYKFYFDILCPMDQLEMGKVYTMADCDPSFTYLSDNTTYNMIKFSDLALELSMTEDEKMVADAKCTTEDGDTYHLYYKPLVRPETFTEVVVEDLDMRFKNFTETMGAFQFVGTNKEYELAFCMDSDGQIEGSWTTENVFEVLNLYTYLYKNGKEVKLCDVELEVVWLGDNNYHIDGKMYAYNGNVYLVSDDYIEPTPQTTAELVATNLKVDDSIFDMVKQFYGYGQFSISASNDEYTISGSLISYDEIVGHYTNDVHKVNYLDIMNNADSTKTSIFSGDFDVENNENGEWTIKGKMLGWNNTEYTVDLSFVIPEITGEGSFTSTTGELLDFTNSLGAFQVWALDEEENEFSVVLSTSDTGKYTEMSPDFPDYCYISRDGKFYEMYSCDFDVTVDVEAEVFTMTGTCQAGELLYTVNISGTYYPEEQEVDPYDATAEDGEVDVAYTLDEVTEFEISEEEGYAYLSAESAERMDAWAVMFFVEGNELPAGEYPLSETFEPGTAQTGLIYNNNLYPTMYFKFDDEGYATIPVWYCTTGSIYVAYDEQGNIMIECKALNSNGVPVHVTVNMPEGVGIEQVATKTQKDGKFFEQNTVVIRSNGRKYNTFGHQIK